MMTTDFQTPLGWSINDWLQAYRQGQSPAELLAALRASIEQSEFTDGQRMDGSSWISLASEAQLQQQLEQLAERLQQLGDISLLPLYGVPCAIKDNIDVAGFNTTAACPSFAYLPDQDAHAVTLLKQAGAIVLGKTNLDQFATGLVGTRSPYGAVPNPFNSDYISGGSSSGSAVALASGQVAFSLGTDTAGSGRVPAGFNHLLGLKPSRGVISTRGVVPACRSLDCISVFALNSQDANSIYQVLAQYDGEDSYARPLASTGKSQVKTLAVPQQIDWFGDDYQQQAFEQACEQAKRLGYRLKTIDFSPMLRLAELLYQGPWVAERFAAVGEFIRSNMEADLDPVVAAIIGEGDQASAVDAFNAEYQRQALGRQIQQVFEQVDALWVPTTPCLPTQAQVNSAPVEINSRLGTFTNFVNLADLSALEVPSHLRADGLPFGITLVAPAFSESALLQFAQHWQAELALPSAPALLDVRPEQTVVLAVVGAHLTGMPLNFQLTSRHAQLLEQTHTASHYRLYALANTTPPKPGLVRAVEGEAGHSIIVELWRLDLAAFGSFVAEIPQPLGIGTLELADGRLVKGFICEPAAVPSATDISHFGGWRAYIAQLSTTQS